MSKRFYVSCLTLICLVAIGYCAYGQNQINLVNPSFEGMPGRGMVPKGWQACQVDGETPPDIHPRNFFNVSTEPADGSTYVGLLARENHTWESIYQKLSTPLKSGLCYTVSFSLCKSDKYLVGTGDRLYPYTHPLVFQIWGGNAECNRKQLLAKSDLIDHTDWREYTFKLSPQSDLTYIMVEAYFETLNLFSAPNGNILLDNASHIEPVSCDFIPPKPVASPEPIVQILEPLQKVGNPKNLLVANAVCKNLTPEQVQVKINGELCNEVEYDLERERLQAKLYASIGMNIIEIFGKNEFGESFHETRYIIPFSRDETVGATSLSGSNATVKGSNIDLSKLKYLDKMDLSKASVGSKMVVEGLGFDANADKIRESNYPLLAEMSEILKAYPDIKVEISGHTNGNCDDEYCDSLSYRRARSVCKYLESTGVPGTQLVAKGYGKRHPIASNRTRAEAKKNQRVEIKVIEIN